ncbi:stage II sporulation protein Q [Salirhabdus euzebyi]|uniref:Stage II sporulation protein Q n=1 Tax=Salirhabdus euzebyi TaxID=394506 RepID=A0A841Q6K4_9BACI|nr:M23 family metallopeptidase [Salirhabdus euzebyi]MBB6453983.1 stage II sporulation protein Q [Salirhabdus euzebyi]
MKEEGKRPNSENSTWKKLVRKKWFYPAVYLTFASLILATVLWYQNQAIDLPDETQTDGSNLDNYLDTPFDENQDAAPVIDQDEMLKMPVANADETQIVTKFWDYDASTEDKEQALILYNNKYYQSVGLDIASANDEPFEVTAALSGTVTEVKEDPLLGMVVELTHDNGVTTNYASLGDVAIETGAEVKQGDVIGTAGRNLFGQANGIHVHFELRKDNNPLNPEEYFNKSLRDIKEPSDEEEEGNEDDAKEEDEASTGEDVEDQTDQNEDPSHDENENEQQDNNESSASTASA